MKEYKSRVLTLPVIAFILLSSGLCTYIQFKFHIPYFSIIMSIPIGIAVGLYCGARQLEDESSRGE